MKTRLLILMSMLIAAPTAAQDGEASGGGEFGTEAEVSGGGEFDSDTETAGAGEFQDDAVAEVAPIAYTHRSITVPKGTLRIDVGPADRALLQKGGFSIQGNPGDALIDLRAGAAFGIIDGLEAGAMILPLSLSPEADYGNPSVYGRFRILDGSFQLGAQVTAVIPVQDGSSFGLNLGVPIKIMLGNGAHLNTGLEFEMTFADPDAFFGIEIPLELAFNITESIFAGVATGVYQPNLDFSQTFIPLGVFAGYTLSMGNGMVLDATVDFSFPAFLVTEGADNPVTDIWQLTFGGVMRMDLL